MNRTGNRTTSGPAGANLLALRSHNTALVLDLLRGAGAEGISRLELAERTGLTPQAVSKITARLREAGLAAEAGRRASTGGKPRTVLRLVPEAGHAVGVHLDRDELRLVLVDLDGTVVGERRVAVGLGFAAGSGAGADAGARSGDGTSGHRVASGAGAGALAGAGAGAEAEVGVEGPAWSGAGVDAEAGRRGVSSLAGDGEVSGAAGESARGRAEDVVAAVAREIAGLVAEVLGDDGDDGDDGGDGDGRGDGGGAGEEGGADGSGYAPGTGDAGHGGAGGVGGGGVHGLAGVGTLLGVGVALPGPLDHVGGVLHRVTGFPEWEGFPLRDALAERLGVPVVVDKDTNAAALGLSVGGEGGSFAYLHLGTGLGAGLVIGGSVHRGTRTGAGEFGHQVLQLDGVPCGCGDRGCMEALCLAAVERGDVAEAARVLGVGAGNLAGLLDIDLVLLGGRTVAGAPEAYVSGVAGVLAARARREGAPGGTVPVRVAPGGERGVAEGAAQLLLAPMFGRADG